MASLLDQLIAQYGNGSSNPYATQAPQPVPAQVGNAAPAQSVPITSLIDTLGRGPQNPYAKMGAPAADPNAFQIVPISDEEAADAMAQQAPAPDNSRVSGMQNAAPVATQAAPTPAPQAQSKVVQPTGPLAQADGSAPPVATVNTDSSFPSPSDYNADGTQASGGGLLNALADAGQQASQDPIAAKGILSTLGDYASGLGQKLKSLSPAASQALIASGMTMLAGNDGTRNLAQLVGMGGIAGMNQYQTIVQNQNANQIARQKLAQDLAEKAAANATANYQAVTERAKALNNPTVLKPGEGVITPGMQMSGQQPTMLGGANGQLPVAREVEFTDGQGNVMTQGVDIWGHPVGPAMPKTLAFTGPVNDAQQKYINDAQTAANNSAASLSRTQNFLRMLTPTIPDPNDPTKTISNPEYVGVTGGVGATVANELNKLTGGQTQSQMLRQEIQQQVYNAQLKNWKSGVGGRLTNADIMLLQKGMPPDNASGQALQQYLQAYSHLQEDQATRDALTAQYIAQNRGDMGPLHPNASITVGGKTYGPGSTMAQVLTGEGGTSNGQQSNGFGTTQQQIIAELRRRGALH